MYRTNSYLIKKHSKLHSYCNDLCFKSARLYNRVNFIVRNYATAVSKFLRTEPLTANELEVYALVHAILDGTRHELSENVKWLSYGRLNYFLQYSNDNDYNSLPKQTSQQILKLLIRDYKSFFESLKEFNLHPEKFTGRPKLPHYKGKDRGTTTIFTNQDCVVYKNKFLKFPKTKVRYNIGLFPTDYILKEVRISPCGVNYTLQVVTDIPDTGILYDTDDKDFNTDKNILNKCSDINNVSDLNIMSIDPGLNNFCAVTGNNAFKPLIVNGRILKSVNQLYNKELATLKSKAELCNNAKSTKHIRNLTSKRNRRIKDMMHKISRYLTDIAVSNDIQLVIFGHNKMQKQNINIGHKNNQEFVQLPMFMLVDMLRYKLNSKGIEFVCVEESYTSKADFKAMDYLPVYSENTNNNYTFSGTRIKRGLYQHADGSLSNADINGAANIMRKVFPKQLQWDSGCVNHPKIVTIA